MLNSFFDARFRTGTPVQGSCGTIGDYAYAMASRLQNGAPMQASIETFGVCFVMLNSFFDKPAFERVGRCRVLAAPLECVLSC